MSGHNTQENNPRRDAWEPCKQRLHHCEDVTCAHHAGRLDRTPRGPHPRLARPGQMVQFRPCFQRECTKQAVPNTLFTMRPFRPPHEPGRQVNELRAGVTSCCRPVSSVSCDRLEGETSGVRAEFAFKEVQQLRRATAGIPLFFSAGEAGNAPGRSSERRRSPMSLPQLWYVPRGHGCVSPFLLQHQCGSFGNHHFTLFSQTFFF